MKAKVIGFQAYEDIFVSLINVGRCKSCDKLYYFNGLPPAPTQPCPSCKKPVGGDDSGVVSGDEQVGQGTRSS